jgi:hypothetical protein
MLLLKILATWSNRRLCFGGPLTDVYEGLLIRWEVEFSKT